MKKLFPVQPISLGVDTACTSLYCVFECSGPLYLKNGHSFYALDADGLSVSLVRLTIVYHIDMKACLTLLAN